MGTIKTRRILIVDDHADSAELLAEALDDRGHEVHVAHDGSDGLAAAASAQLDVVVLDIGLPDMDGYELARRLRSLPHLQHGVLFVSLSGYSGGEHHDLALAAGFDAQLVKPVSPEILVQTVESDADAWTSQQHRSLI